MDYATFKATAAALDAEISASSATLNAFPHDGPMGLTSDAVKFSPEYQAAKTAYNRAALKLSNLNHDHAKRFSKEIRADRDARRQALLSAAVAK